MNCQEGTSLPDCTFPKTQLICTIFACSISGVEITSYDRSVCTLSVQRERRECHPIANLLLLVEPIGTRYRQYERNSKFFLSLVKVLCELNVHNSNQLLTRYAAAAESLIQCVRWSGRY